MLHIYNAMWLQTSCDIQYLIDQYNFWVQPFTGVRVSMNPANFVTEERKYRRYAYLHIIKLFS
jgi:hypothetical protein